MLKILYSIILLLSLTGCYQSVNLPDIKGASVICGGLDEVLEIQSIFVGDERVTCINRSTYFINNENLKSAKEKSK